MWKKYVNNVNKKVRFKTYTKPQQNNLLFIRSYPQITFYILLKYSLNEGYFKLYTYSHLY